MVLIFPFSFSLNTSSSIYNTSSLIAWVTLKNWAATPGMFFPHELWVWVCIPDTLVIWHRPKHLSSLFLVWQFTSHQNRAVNSNAVVLWSVLVLVLDCKCYCGHLVNGWCACKHKNINVAYAISSVFQDQKPVLWVDNKKSRDCDIW